MSLLLFGGAGGGSGTNLPLGEIESAEAVDGPTMVYGQDVPLGDANAGETIDGPTIDTTVTVTLDGIASGEAMGAPNVYEPKSIVLPSIANEPNVPGLTFSQTYPAGAPQVPRIRAWLYSSDYSTEIAELDESWGKNWKDLLSDPGAWGATLQNDDADLAACSYGRIVRMTVDGLAVFPGLIETKNRNEVAQGEEAEQYTVLGGRGTMAQWEDAVVFPELGVDVLPFTDQRIFNFASTVLDDSAWPNAIVTPLLFDDSVGTPLSPPISNTKPKVWPDETAEWIWDRDSGSNGVPSGQAFMRHGFSVASETEVEIWAAADDAYEIWLDGKKMFDDSLESGGYYKGQSKSARTVLSAGTHLLAARVVNKNNLKAGFICTVMELDEDGQRISVVTNSGGDWLCIAYTDPPGFTPGHVIRILLEEAQTRGSLSNWTLGFDDNVDSNGNAWPVSTELAARVGLDYLAVLRQLAEAYIDVSVAPALLRLDAWNIGELGGSTGVIYSAANENLLSLTSVGQG